MCAYENYLRLKDVYVLVLRKLFDHSHEKMRADASSEKHTIIRGLLHIFQEIHLEHFPANADDCGGSQRTEMWTISVNFQAYNKQQ